MVLYVVQIVKTNWWFVILGCIHKIWLDTYSWSPCQFRSPRFWREVSDSHSQSLHLWWRETLSHKKHSNSDTLWLFHSYYKVNVILLHSCRKKGAGSLSIEQLQQSADVLTVQSQYGWWEWRWVGEGELDGVFFRPLEKLCGLLALLLLTSLLLALLLLPGQGLFSLLLLRGNMKQNGQAKQRSQLEIQRCERYKSFARIQSLCCPLSSSTCPIERA